jgi:hypothetical protein
MKTTILLVVLTAALFACGTHLSSTSARDLRNVQIISSKGFAGHTADTDPDKLRFNSIYCGAGSILNAAGEAQIDGGVPCR